MNGVLRMDSGTSPGLGGGRAAAADTGRAGTCPRGEWMARAPLARGLAALVRARLVVAALALPLGLLFRPDATEAMRSLFLGSAAAVVGLSLVFALAARTRRLLVLQAFAQLAVDLVLVTALAAHTGGRGSQFVLFYVLVVITGGLLMRFPGGLFAAAGAGVAYLLLPALAAGAGVSWSAGDEPGLPPGMLIAFTAIVGVLAGGLGRRVHAAHDDLERTARELARVRVDNDVILRQLATGVLTVDAWGTVAYLNPAAEQVLGLRTAQLRGRTIDQALPERLGLLRQVIQDSLSRGLPRTRVELTGRTESGEELSLGVTTNLLRHEGAITGVVAVFQDLTEVRAMERRARRNQTLAEVGALAAGIAHELRNGLNPISGSVEFLQRELKPEGESGVLMDLIVKECARLNRFVGDLLSYARERDLVVEPIDLGEHLAQLRDGLLRDPRCGPGVRLLFEPPGTGVKLRGDREQLRQVWLNLVNNALDAMKNEGDLMVRWRALDERRALIEFEDQGAGIPPEILPRVGEPFFTTKNGGTGLGVAIAQRIVERHGGTLSFESTPGRGTVARVSLPVEIGVLAEAA
jgi:two-component system sensor histidine kinase PilS (NtrC family)